MSRLPAIALNDGTTIPAVGLGTFPHHGDDSAETVRGALGIGYRLLDTALSYGNEALVGAGLLASGLPRNEVVVTTKVPGRYHGYRGAFASLAASRANLNLERIDLLLIHWPLPRLGRYVDTWRAMIAMRTSGVVRSIGVSNFTSDHLRRLIDETGVVPAVNQIELHPYFQQEALLAFHADCGIVTEAWSPLGRGGSLLNEPILTGIAAAHGVAVGQVVLRWQVQRGVVPIPMSSQLERQRSNFDLAGFALDDDEMAAVATLERGRIWGLDPNTYEEF